MSISNETWRLRRGDKGNDPYAFKPSEAYIIDSPNHGMFALVVARMRAEKRDRPDLLERAMLATAAPELERMLREMLGAFDVEKRGRLSSRKRAALENTVELLHRIKEVPLS